MYSCRILQLSKTISKDNKYDFYPGGVMNETREKQLLS